MSKPIKPIRKGIYSIFNHTDFTNDHMLKLLTTQLALKARIRVDSLPKECNKSLN